MTIRAILERDVIPCAREIAAAAKSRGHGFDETCNCAACRNDRADIFFKYFLRHQAAQPMKGALQPFKGALSNE